MVCQHSLSRNELCVSHFLGHPSFYFVFTTWDHKRESLIIIYQSLDNTERLDASTPPWENCLHIWLPSSGTRRPLPSEYIIATIYGCWQTIRQRGRFQSPGLGPRNCAEIVPCWVDCWGCFKRVSWHKPSSSALQNLTEIQVYLLHP